MTYGVMFYDIRNNDVSSWILSRICVIEISNDINNNETDSNRNTVTLFVGYESSALLLS